MENDTFYTLPNVEILNRTCDPELYKAIYNVRIKPEVDLYPKGFDFFNYSGAIVKEQMYELRKQNPQEWDKNEEKMDELFKKSKNRPEEENERNEKGEDKNKGKRKKRNVVVKDAKKEEQTNQILRDMIIDKEYEKDMTQLKEKIKDKAHIKDYLFINFEEKDWLKRYKRELSIAFEDLKQNMGKKDLFERDVNKQSVKSRVRRDLTNFEKEKSDFTNQLQNFEVNQANIKSMIDKGIGLNMQKAMKLSIDYAMKSFVNTSSSLDESVQRFFIMKQEYMNLIDKWYHGVVIDLPNYLKSQERKKINLSFDDEQPTDEERQKLNKLNEYERVIDREFAEVGIHYGKTLLNNYCDLDDLFYKYHRDNNQCNIETVFSVENTKELLKRQKIM